MNKNEKKSTKKIKKKKKTQPQFDFLKNGIQLFFFDQKKKFKTKIVSANNTND